MKKVGIMSMQRVENYGSVLQAFALKKIVQSLGADVEFVDFKLDNPGNNENALPLRRGIKDKLKTDFADIGFKTAFLRNNKLRKLANSIRCQHLYEYKFVEDIFPDFGILPERNERPELDLLIIGSDEVFNLKQNLASGYSLELFGENNRAKKMISFSGSFGYTDIDYIHTSGISARISELLSAFDQLSARDKNTCEIIRQLTGREAQYHLDPVFHFDYTPYMPEINKKKQYIAVYAHSNIDERIKQQIRSMAVKYKMDILCFMGYQGDLGEFIEADPFEVLSYIKHAKFVVTTTFHGSVFSIKYKKQFAAVIKDESNKAYSNRSKLGDLLERLKLQDRVIGHDKANIEDILMVPIDYNATDEILNENISSGLEYLRENISNA